MVCFFHMACGNPDLLPSGNILKKICSGGWSGVEVFFVISGFVIPFAMYRKNYTLSNFPIFLKKRIIRIEPPYLLSIGLVLLLNFISTLSPYYRGLPFTIDWANLLGHLAYLNVFTGRPFLNPVYWTLAIEFQYYILIALVFGLIVSKAWPYRVLFFMGFMASSFIPLPPNAFILGYSPFFMAGILLFQYVCKVISIREFSLLTCATLVLSVYRQDLFTGFLVAATLLTITYVNEVPAFLRYLGLVSYSLYLIHVPVGGRIINLAESRTHNLFLRECAVLLAFGVCILFSGLFYKYVEKTFKKWSGAIRYDKDRSLIEKPGLSINRSVNK